MTFVIPADSGAVLAMTLREAVTDVISHAEAGACAIELARALRGWSPTTAMAAAFAKAWP